MNTHELRLKKSTGGYDVVHAGTEKSCNDHLEGIATLQSSRNDLDTKDVTTGVSAMFLLSNGGYSIVPASNTQHTPGPWKVELTTMVNTFIDAEDGTPICKIPMDLMKDKDAIKIANAKLIAAAPELLKALQAALPIVMCAMRNQLLDGEPSRADINNEVTWKKIYTQCDQQAKESHQVKSIQSAIEKATK